jgi:hypothetical protein
MIPQDAHSHSSACCCLPQKSDPHCLVKWKPDGTDGARSLAWEGEVAGRGREGQPPPAPTRCLKLGPIIL